MKLSIRWLPSTLLLLLVACEASTTPAAAGDAVQPVADAPAPAAVQAADIRSDYVLTMEDVDAYLATMAHASAAARENPDLEDVLAMDAEESVEAFAARLESDVTAKGLATSAGLEVREFATVASAFLSGVMTAGAMESGALQSIPDGIDPRHVAFAREHMTELKAKMAAIDTGN